MRKAVLISLVIILVGSISAGAQKFYTKTGKVSFFSSTSMENITANNKSTVCLLDSKTGDIQFAVLLKGFEFRKALMQEHFNTDYVESDKFPKSEFKGQVTNNSSVNYTTDGSYPVTVKGKMTLHGETKDVEASGTIVVKDGKVQANSVFNILLADYKVSIPNLYRDNISKSIKITVDCLLEKLAN